MSRVLAFDFGASSGRAILGTYENGELSYREVHRFENNPRDKDGHFRWDFEDLLANVRLGAQKAGPVDSLAFDTWGVDFGLLDAQGRLLEDPVHYRDQRTAGLVEEAFQSLPAGALYGATGTQILNINSLYQLLALQRQEPQLWEKAHRLLFMPDLFAWALCGAQACETTIASTSQLLDPRSQSWSQQVLSAFHIPQELFAPLVKSGTVVGEYQGAKVIAAAGHDTQCAVAAMPAPEKDAAFLSCGTWSLLGCELEEPVLTGQSRVLGLSNEIGANGKVNYLKNIIGLWLIQESRRQWRREGQEYSYADLERLALEAQLHRPGRAGVRPSRGHPRPGAGLLPPHRPARPRDGGPGDALHLREPGVEIPLCPGPADPGHRQEVLRPPRAGRRHQGRPALPHDRRLHRHPRDSRARGGHRPGEHPHPAEGPGPAGEHRPRPGAHRPHRKGHPL